MSVRRRETPRGEALLKVPDPVLREEGVRALTRAVRRSGLREVRLDLGAVGLVTGGGLGRLVALQRQLRAVGGRLTLCNVSGLVYGEFEATRLTEVLAVRRKGGGEG